MVKSTEHNIQPDQPNKLLPFQNFSSSVKKKYKGVRMRSWGSWVSEIRAPNQKIRIWLGSHPTAEAAARAYDAALICLKGSSAADLNFPTNYSSYQLPHAQDTTVIMSPKSIQKVAAAAAAASNCSIYHAKASAIPSAPPLPSSSTILSSPSMSMSSSSSSPFEHIIDDSILLIPGRLDRHDSFYDINNYAFAREDNNVCTASMGMQANAPWFECDAIHSPKYNDPMMNSVLFDSSMMMSDDQQHHEEDDFRLWSFC